MKIYLAQIEIEQGRLASNFEKIKTVIKLAKEKGTSLVVLPELCISGNALGDLFKEKSFVEECLEYNKKIAELSLDVDILFGNLAQIPKEESLYSGVYYAKQGKFLPLVNLNGIQLDFLPKTFSRNTFLNSSFVSFDELLKEKGVSFLDSLLCPIETETEVLGIVFSDSIKCAEESALWLSTKNAANKTLVNLSANVFELENRKKLYDAFESTSKKNSVSILYANAAGVANEAKNIYALEGGSAYFTGEGKAFQLKLFSQDAFVFNSCSIESKPVESSNLTPIQEIHKALVYMIKGSLKRFGIKRVVIGASGGIDSAVSAALYAEAIGSENVFLVNMPTRFNSQTTKDAARDLAKNLGSPYGVVPISDILNSVQSTFSQTCFERCSENLSVEGIHFENLQARTRSGAVLATLASILNAVFTCNGNKTEAMVGYCTLYGDTSGIFCVLGDLWKTQVYALAKEINKEKEIIPKASIEIPASAELSDAQNIDEGKGDPIIYPYHDKLFAYWMECNKSLTDTEKALDSGELCNLLQISEEFFRSLFATKEEALEDMRYWWKRYKGIACAKRIQMPPILSVSKRAFGNSCKESQL